MNLKRLEMLSLIKVLFSLYLIYGSIPFTWLVAVLFTEVFDKGSTVTRGLKIMFCTFMFYFSYLTVTGFTLQKLLVAVN